MTAEQTSCLQGQCSCGELEYELRGKPLFTHACHCLDCQRKSGSAFSITCIVLEREIAITKGGLSNSSVSARSTLYHCQKCRGGVYVTSSAFPATALLLPASLIDPRALQIGAHIWVKRKQDWLLLPEDVPQFDEDYDRATTWPTESLLRLEQENPASR